jgi:tRNA (guanine37-N1)-methyltransferase
MPHRPTNEGRSPWRATVLTLFPEMFPGPLAVSNAGQALESRIWSLKTVSIRDFGVGKHRTVDDTPAGGGAGMIMRADVLGAAIDHARTVEHEAPLIYLSPRGERLNQSLAAEFAAGPGLLLLTGRFEGIDERVIAGRGLREVSIGDYVLSGGELAAMVLIDACVRLLPGVVAAPTSLDQESFEKGLLEYPQYTKPREWEGRTIPEVLLSGNHTKIADWRRAEAQRLTEKRRPDLLKSQKPGRKS